MNADISKSSFRYDNTEMWFEMLLQVSYIESVNNIYNYNRRAGIPFLRPEVVRMKSIIREQITRADPLKYCKEWLLPHKCFKVNYNFILKQGFFKRDTDNCVKMVQDAVFECLNINDTRATEIYARRLYKPEASSEYIILRVARCNYDYDELK